jgi:hypothetical protein
VYGNVTSVHPKYPGGLFDMAHVYAGGRVVFTSDQHFGMGSNLILPGRGWSIVAYRGGCSSHSVGKDMSDGWETKRSRQTGHKDWAIIKLYVSRLQVVNVHSRFMNKSEGQLVVCPTSSSTLRISRAISLSPVNYMASIVIPTYLHTQSRTLPHLPATLLRRMEH